jgi:O-6-methylguanine DNA methyltransferase
VALLPDDKTARAQKLKEELDAFPQKKLATPSIHVDLTGTEFQKKVWLGLQKIKVGTTRSYTDFTLDLGFSKNSTRAVATAIAKNPISILWPCHRVIAKDGTLGGFAGGLRAKQQLLNCEARLNKYV